MEETVKVESVRLREEAAEAAERAAGWLRNAGPLGYDVTEATYYLERAETLAYKSLAASARDGGGR